MEKIYQKNLPSPNERQMEWYSRGLTAFIHFGMNTFTDREWGDGTESPETFNPSELNAEQWVKTLKDAGFGSAILTAKHHDGFCLWPSAYTEHSVKNSPFRGGHGDVVREFCDACEKYGMKAGIYLSPWDRHEKTWGSDEYNDYYVNQLTELLSNYGKIYEVWWDGAGSKEAVYDWDRWAATVRSLQPDAVIFGSLGAVKHVDVRWVGNERGYAGKPCWASIDESSLITEVRSELNTGKVDGERFIPAEVDVSIRPGWFYHKHQDNEVRTPENLMYLWSCSIGRNAGLLLNIPPDRRGLFHENDVTSLLEFKSRLDRNLSADLANGASVFASSEYSEKYSSKNILSKDRNEVFAPKEDDSLPTVTLKLTEKKRINTVILGELVEYGHRITEYTVEAKIASEWKELFTNNSLGYTSCEHFEEIETDEVRLIIKKYRGIPLLNKFSVHRFSGHIAAPVAIVPGKDLTKGPAVVITREDSIIDINLGGVYPFNTVKIDSDELLGIEVEAFNGTRFEPCNKMHVEVGDRFKYRLDKTVDYAYRLRLKLTEAKKNNSRNVSVFYEE